MTNRNIILKKVCMSIKQAVYRRVQIKLLLVLADAIRNIRIDNEPTRGIDVGAKNEIYKLMTLLAEEGKSIIMISSELQEILRMSDRVACMCEGRITKILNIEEASQETIMKYATRRN